MTDRESGTLSIDLLVLARTPRCWDDVVPRSFGRFQLIAPTSSKSTTQHANPADRPTRPTRPDPADLARPGQSLNDPSGPASPASLWK